MSQALSLVSNTPLQAYKRIVMDSPDQYAPVGRTQSSERRGVLASEPTSSFMKPCSHHFEVSVQGYLSIIDAADLGFRIVSMTGRLNVSLTGCKRGPWCTSRIVRKTVGKLAMIRPVETVKGLNALLAPCRQALDPWWKAFDRVAKEV